MKMYHYFVSYARPIKHYSGSDSFISEISDIERSEKIKSINDILDIRNILASKHPDTHPYDIFILNGPTLIQDEPYW